MRRRLFAQQMVFVGLAVLGLAIASPHAVVAQVSQSTNEIKLGETSSPPGGAQPLLVETGGTTSPAPGGGPEALGFDGTYVWVTRQFKDTVVRLRASDGLSSGSFAVGRRPVALLVAGNNVWVANL